MIRAASKRRKQTVVTPEDNGKRMSLDDFEFADVQEGYLYELGRGVIEVSNVPSYAHAKQVEALRDQLTVYKLKKPGSIKTLAGAADAKLLIARHFSERHPDLFIYCSDPPRVSNPWPIWLPDIVVEVVSRSSKRRDYVIKTEEYLDLGIGEYWIVDSAREELTAHVRWRGMWKSSVIKPGKKYSTPKLPGFSLDLKKVFNAAK